MAADTSMQAAPLLAVDSVTLQYKTEQHLVTATWRVGFEVYEGERFVVQTVGLTISSDAKLKIEQAINDAVKATLARHDAGPVAITPLSQIKAFGAGLGGATAGMIARIEKIR